MVDSEEPKNGEDQQPEESSQDADWLDELATQISEEWGSDTVKTGDPDTLLEPHEGDEIPAWLKADLEKEVASDEQVPDWLVPELANAGAIATSLDRASTSQDSSKDEPNEDLDQTLVIQPGRSSTQAEPPGGLDEEELDWLNRMSDNNEVVSEDFSGIEADLNSDISNGFDIDPDLSSEINTAEEETADVLPHIEAETTAVDEKQTEENEPLPPGTGQLTWMEDIAAVEKQMRVGDEAVEIFPETGMDNSVSAPTEPLSMEQVGPEEEATVFAEVPEDPDEAMAWLESLAAKQGAPEDELVSQQESTSQIEADATATDIDQIEPLSDIEMIDEDFDNLTDEHGDMPLEAELDLVESVGLEDTVVFSAPANPEGEMITMKGVDGGAENLAEQEIPEDPDEAMAWLEKLAAEQGASESDLESIEAELLEIGLEEETSEGEVIEFEQDQIIEPAFDFTSDLDEALDWLEQIVDLEVGESAEALEVVEEPPTPHVVHDVSAAFDEAVFDGEVPEAQLVEREEKSAEVEEVAATNLIDSDFSEQEVLEEKLEEEYAILDEIDTEMDEQIADLDIEESTVEAEVMQGDDETAEAFAWLDHLAEAESNLPVEMAIEELDETAHRVGEASQQQAEETIESPDESFIEKEMKEPKAEHDQDLAWLDSLGEKEEQQSAELPQEVEAVDLMDLPSSEDLIQKSPETVDLREPDLDEEELLEEDEAEAVVEEILRDIGREELSFARTALEAGEMALALARYESLLDDPTIVPFVISDLEEITDQEAGQVILHRTLGDAYVRNGQLKRALDTYRKALDSL